MKVHAKGTLKLGAMVIPVDIHDINSTYGRTRYSVSAVGGRGRVNKEDVEVDLSTLTPLQQEEYAEMVH